MSVIKYIIYRLENKEFSYNEKLNINFNITSTSSNWIAWPS